MHKQQYGSTSLQHNMSPIHILTRLYLASVIIEWDAFNVIWSQFNNNKRVTNYFY